MLVRIGGLIQGKLVARTGVANKSGYLAVHKAERSDSQLNPCKD